MANYATTDARATLLFRRRRTGPNTEVIEQMRVRRIRFDIETTAGQVQYLEPLSDANFAVQSRVAGEYDDQPTPVEAIEFVDGNLIPSPSSGQGESPDRFEVARFD